MGDAAMHAREYPDLSITGRTWRIFGSRAGEGTSDFFKPEEVDAPEKGRRSWVWVDELISTVPSEEVESRLLEGAHSPHEYSGYELHVRKQPVITTFASHDHIIIPDLDVETPGDRAVPIILYTDFIWTRRGGEIAQLDELLDSSDLRERGPQPDTAVYAFVGILRVMLESLDRQLVRRERETYALEDHFLQNETGWSADYDDGRDGTMVDGDEDPLAKYRALSAPRTLVKLRIGVAWLRKQYGAFERLVNSLYDPAHGAFRNGPALIAEASPYFRHLSDQIKRALTKVEHLRDTHSTLDQLLSAQQTEKTNATLLRLTWLSIIFLPVGVIVDIFGMNISIILPGHSFELDSSIALVAVSLALLAATLFYRRENRSGYLRG